jgi:hypothetical protein
MKVTAIMNEDWSSLFRILLIFSYLYSTEASHSTFKVGFVAILQ